MTVAYMIHEVKSTTSIKKQTQDIHQPARRGSVSIARLLSLAPMHRSFAPVDPIFDTYLSEKVFDFWVTLFRVIKYCPTFVVIE